MTAAPAADVQPLLGHLTNFLSSHGFPVAPFTVGDVFGIPGANTGHDAGVAIPGEVGFSPPVLRQLRGLARNYGRRGPLTDAQVQALDTATHEALHQMRFARTPDVVNTPRGRRMEEGAVAAATEDILPSITASLFGQRLDGARIRDAFTPPAYPGMVRQVRQLSVFGSGAGSFTDRPARVWRRSFLHADEAGRESMWAKAVQRRQAAAAAR